MRFPYMILVASIAMLGGDVIAKPAKPGTSNKFDLSCTATEVNQQRTAPPIEYRIDLNKGEWSCADGTDSCATHPLIVESDTLSIYHFKVDGAEVMNVWIDRATGAFHETIMEGMQTTMRWEGTCTKRPFNSAPPANQF